MSLEQTIEQTNVLLTQIIALMQAGLQREAQPSASPADGDAPKRRGRPTKTAVAELVTEALGDGLAQAAQAAQAAAIVGAHELTEAVQELQAAGQVEQPAVTAEPSQAQPEATPPGLNVGDGWYRTDASPLGLVDGDPVGTRYFVIEKFNTVYAQRPGDMDCTIEGKLIVTAQKYLECKAAFEKKTQEALRGLGAAPATDAAPAPAPSTPAASTASSTPSAAAPDQTPAAAAPAAPVEAAAAPAEDTPFAKLVERITALNKSDKPGHGREGVLSILNKWLPGEERPTVTKLQPLGKNSAILADVEVLLTQPVATAAADEFDPLG
jgi:hypothetical protein